MKEQKVNTVRRKTLSVLAGTLLVMCLFGCGKSTADYIEAAESETVPVEEAETAPETMAFEPETEAELLYIYICGQVQSPGVYQMPEGSRICDLLEAAGGFTAEAALEYWNQARVLVDGEMIYIPTQEEAKEHTLEAQKSAALPEEGAASDGRVNINTASKEELMKIPGIGESKALAILAYRQEHGKFSAIEDIMQVAGVKEGVFEKIKDYIVVN